MVVVGSSLDERNETLTALLVAEVVGLALAVLVAGGAGYAIARAGSAAGPGCVAA